MFFYVRGNEIEACTDMLFARDKGVKCNLTNVHKSVLCRRCINAL